jgi:hypothetical protein
VLATHHLSMFPPRLTPRSIEFAAARAQLFVDSQPSPVGDASVNTAGLAQRALVFANFLGTDVVQRAIARRVGVSPGSFAIHGQTVVQNPAVNPTQGPERANELLDRDADSVLLFRNDQGSQIIQIFSQAPTVQRAVGLATAAAAEVVSMVKRIQRVQHASRSRQVILRQLGTVQGGVVNKGVATVGAILIAVATWLALVMGLRGAARMSGARADRLAGPPSPPIGDV